MTTVHAVIAGHEVDTDPATVLARLRKARPEPIRTHYVVVEGRRFPVIQALSLVTGIDRGKVRSRQAVRLLSRLGLVTGKLGGREDKAAFLRPYMGQWVAVDPDWTKVVYTGSSPYDVVGWLRRNEVRGCVFRVPVEPIDIPAVFLL